MLTAVQMSHGHIGKPVKYSGGNQLRSTHIRKSVTLAYLAFARKACAMQSADMHGLP